MTPRPETTTYTSFRANLSGYFKRLDKKRALIVTQNGKTKAVVMAPSEYEELQDYRERVEVMEAIRKSREDFAAGRYMEVSELRKEMLARQKKRLARRER